jgi:hypothetical protein
MSKIKVYGEPIWVTEKCVVCVVELTSIVKLQDEYGTNLYSPNVRGSLIADKPKSTKFKNKVYRSIFKTLDGLEGDSNTDVFISNNNGIQILVDEFTEVTNSQYDIGSLVGKYRGINNGCQTVSTVFDYLKQNGKVPPNQKVLVKINIGTSEKESKELTISNNCHNSVSEKDILLAFSDELNKSVEDYSDGEYTLKTKKGSAPNKKSIVIDLTKMGRTNTMLSYILEKPFLNGGPAFKQYKDELFRKANGRSIVEMFKLEQKIAGIFKGDETFTKYHKLTNGYIKNPILTAVKQLNGKMGSTTIQNVVNSSIGVIKELVNDDELKGWIQKKENCLLFCEKLKVTILLNSK